MNNISVQLSQIVVNPDLQPRINGLDNDHVKALEAGYETWPPLSVIKHGEQQYLLIDGFHRLAAAQNLALRQVSVQVLEPPQDGDLYALAFSLNALHGHPLSLSDRKAFAQWLLKAHPSSSDREIGRRSGLAQPTVASLRTELEKSAQIEQTTVREGKGGYTYAVRPKEESESDTDDSSDSPEEEVVSYLQQCVKFFQYRKKIEAWQTEENAVAMCLDYLGEDKAKTLGVKLEKTSLVFFKVACRLQGKEL